ncbi:MAG: type II toxin-antitoxin system RelE/ParE family toxin [Spartobacteria bacterium]
MKLLLAPRTKEDILEIWEFIAAHDEVAADRYIDHLRDRALELIAFPQLGRTRDEIQPGLRSLLARNHLIFYRLQDAEIQVLRILHGSMDLPNQEISNEM